MRGEAMGIMRATTIPAAIRRRASILLTGLVLALIALAVPGAAHAAGTLDQQQTDGTGGDAPVFTDPGGLGRVTLGQLFTAGRSGQLDRVELYMQTSGETADAPLTVTIETVSDGVPTGTVLASASIDPTLVSRTPAWVTATFAAPAAVQAGTQYAIVGASTASAFGWWDWLGSSADAYTGGDGLFRIDSRGDGWQRIFPLGADFAFKTYVEAPPTVQFLDPLTQSTNDGTIVNTAKNGRVVAIRVQLSQDGTAITDANAPGPVTLTVTNVGACGSAGTTDPVDVYAAGASSTGNAFRYDAATGAWFYNLDTRAMGLKSGNCYRIDAAVDGAKAVNAWAILEPLR